MPYNQNIPESTDLISQSQQDILGNFQSADSSIALEHNAFSAATDPGKHKFVTLQEQVAAPTTIADQGALYSKAVSGATQLFWKKELDGTEQQISNLTIASTASGGGTSYGVDNVNGIKERWGSFQASGATAAVTFTSAMTVQSIVAVQQGDTGGSRACTITVVIAGSQYTFNVSNTNASGWYYARGV